MIRLLHTADVHLDSPLKSLAMRDPVLREKLQSASREAFLALVDYAIEEQVSALLIAGDLFDGNQRSAKTAAFLLGELDRLDRHHVLVYYIKGNHDAESPITGSVEFPSNVHVFSGHGGKHNIPDTSIWVHGVSFSAKQAPDSLLGKFSPPVPDAVNIGLLHTSLAGSASHDVYAPCSVEQLKTHGFDYWALGHIHKRQIHATDPWVVMPGIPQGRDIGEAGPKSATLLTIENGEITTQELRTSVVEFIELRIDLTDVQSESQLREHLRKHLKELVATLSSSQATVRVTLAGHTPLRWPLIRDLDIWQASVSDIAADCGPLWLEKLILDLQIEPSKTPDTSALAELETIMSTISCEDEFNTRARAEIEAVVALLPTEQRSEFFVSEEHMDQLLAELLGQGAEHVLAAMRGSTI